MESQCSYFFALIFYRHRKFGSYIYELASEKTLMFWGGEHETDVSMTVVGRRSPALFNRLVPVRTLPAGHFEVSISGGLARSSRYLSMINFFHLIFLVILDLVGQWSASKVVDH